MPASSVASTTPATGGISGNEAGARGEMVVDMMLVIPGRVQRESGIHNHDAIRYDRSYGFRPSLRSAGMTKAFKTPCKGNSSLLRRRGGIERGVRGRRLVETLDGGGLAQILHQLRLRAMGDVICDLRLPRIGQLPLVELESPFGEFRHHLVLGEIAEIAAFGRARIFGLLLRQRGEVGTSLELGEDRFGFLLGRDQDMARVHLL